MLESVDVCEANVWPSRFEVLWAAFLDLLVVGEKGWGSRSARGRFMMFQLLQPILFQPEQFSTIELLVRCFNWASMSSVPPDAQTVGARRFGKCRRSGAANGDLPSASTLACDRAKFAASYFVSGRCVSASCFLTLLKRLHSALFPFKKLRFCFL